MIAEKWRAPPGYEGRYEVSNLGRIRSVDRTFSAVRSGMRTTVLWRGRLMKPYVCGKGYGRISLRVDGIATRWLIHRLVALAFIPNPHGLPQVAHRDGNPRNNAVPNLVWTDQSGNEAHKVDHGRDRRGSKHPLARLRKTDVLRIRASTERAVDLAAKYGVTSAHISQIRAGRRWQHV